MQVQKQIFCLNGNLEKIAQFQAVTGAWRIHALRRWQKGRRFDRPDLTACSATLKRSATGRNGEGRFVGGRASQRNAARYRRPVSQTGAGFVGVLRRVAP
jgi:hypothetical protein